MNSRTPHELPDCFILSYYLDCPLSWRTRWHVHALQPQVRGGRVAARTPEALHLTSDDFQVFDSDPMSAAGDPMGRRSHGRRLRLHARGADAQAVAEEVPLCARDWFPFRFCVSFFGSCFGSLLGVYVLVSWLGVPFLCPFLFPLGFLIPSITFPNYFLTCTLLLLRWLPHVQNWNERNGN